jgi:hypothetical protein
LEFGASLDAVKTALSEARAFTGLAVLTATSNAFPGITNQDTLTLDQIAMLVKETRYLVAEAFDGFGYLIWERN